MFFRLFVLFGILAFRLWLNMVGLNEDIRESLLCRTCRGQFKIVIFTMLALWSWILTFHVCVVGSLKPISTEFKRNSWQYCLTWPTILNLWTCNGQFKIVIFHKASFVVMNTDFSCLWHRHIEAHFTKYVLHYCMSGPIIRVMDNFKLSFSQC